MSMSRLSGAVVAAIAIGLMSGAASGVEACHEDVVFDLSPFTPPGAAGEVAGVSLVTGTVINAHIEAVFEVTETDPWSMFVNFDFPTGLIGVSSITQGWEGTGVFTFSGDSDGLNGVLDTSDGAIFYPWFMLWGGGAPFELPGGGIGLGPMDGTFTTLELTLTFGTCSEADINLDGAVDSIDLNLLLADFGCTGGQCGDLAADLTGDKTVDSADLNILLGDFGS